MEAEGSLLTIVLVILTWSVSLNLFLTFRIAALIRPEPEPDDKPLTLPIGEALPEFEGRSQLDHSAVSSAHLASETTLILFLSPGCSLCRETVSQIREILPRIRDAGIWLWIVTGKSAGGSARFLGDLTSHWLRVDAGTIRKLNPRNASPFYIMVNDGVVQASYFVGDETWQNFIEKMEGSIVQQAAV